MQDKTKKYIEYFSQPKENLDLIMKSIKIKNEMYSRNLNFKY